MIVYKKKLWGVHLIFQLYGSAIPRALPLTILSTALVALLFYVPGIDYWQEAWRHPYVYSALEFIISFILVRVGKG